MCSTFPALSIFPSNMKGQIELKPEINKQSFNFTGPSTESTLSSAVKELNCTALKEAPKEACSHAQTFSNAGLKFRNFLKYKVVSISNM